MATDNELIVEKLNNLKLLATNNYPLCEILNVCDDTTTDDIVGDETTVTDRTIVFPATYEIIAKNILNFPYTIDISDENYYVKTFTLSDTQSITQTIDMRNPDNIVSTLSGDVPEGVNLIKRVITENDEIRIIYE